MKLTQRLSRDGFGKQAGHYTHILRTALDGFAIMATRDQLCDVVLDAGIKLVANFDPETVATVLLIEKGAWQQIASTRSGGDGLLGRSTLETALKLFLADGDLPETASRAIAQLEVNGRSLFFAPLVLQNKVSGALIFETSHPVPSPIADAIETLCIPFALALAASSRSADIHRQRTGQRFRSLVENSNDGIFIVRPSGQPIFTSSTAERLLQSAGQTEDVFQAVHPQDRSAFIAMVQNAPPPLQLSDSQRTLECRIIVNGGPPRWMDAAATDMTRDPDVAGVVITTHDITERKMLETDLRHRVLHDEVTGIPNRAFLKERADHALSMRRTDHSSAALLTIGINDFKAVNEFLGQDASDDLRKIIAFRLDNFVRGHDTAARLSSDTFAVLLQDVASEADIETVAKRLLNLVQRPVDFDGRNVELNASIGVCVARPDYDSGILLRNADVALHEARHLNSHLAFFKGSMGVNSADRLDLRRDLAHAIERNELVVYYQPLMNLQSNELAGFEALIRWVHPERGLVSPGAFIPLAEESGLIVEIGAWVLGKACSQLSTWRKMRPGLDLKMSINIAPRQLEEHDIAQTIGRIMQETATAPSALVLELTDAEHLEAPAVRERVFQLRNLGVGIAADDFGGGFANYSALQELPFTVVKIDRSLIVGLEANFQKANAYLRSILEMAHSANLHVVAEGIEDSRQCDLLTAMGCDSGQGYFFGRPVAATEAEDFVTGVSSAKPLPV